MKGRLVTGAGHDPVFVSRSGKTRLTLTHLDETDEQGEYEATSEDGRQWWLIDAEDEAELIER